MNIYIIATLPKSGTANLSLRLQALSKHGVRVLNNIDAPPNKMNNLFNPPTSEVLLNIDTEEICQYFYNHSVANKINISVHHYQATPKTLEIIKKLSGKVLVQVRDPRQALVSMIHYVTSVNYMSKLDYEFKDLDFMIDEYLETAFLLLVKFISNWISAQDGNDFGVVVDFTSLDEYKNSPLKYFSKVFKHLDINPLQMRNLDLSPPVVGEKNFRKGELYEFIYLLSDRQLTRMQELIQGYENVFSRFDWMSIDEIKNSEDAKGSIFIKSFMRESERCLYAMRYLVGRSQDTESFASRRQQIIKMLESKIASVRNYANKNLTSGLNYKVLEYIFAEMQNKHTWDEKHNIVLSVDDLAPDMRSHIPDGVTDLFCRVSMTQANVMQISIFYDNYNHEEKLTEIGCFIIKSPDDSSDKGLQTFSLNLKNSLDVDRIELSNYIDNWFNFYKVVKCGLEIDSTTEFVYSDAFLLACDECMLDLEEENIPRSKIKLTL